MEEGITLCADVHEGTKVLDGPLRTPAKQGVMNAHSLESEVQMQCSDIKEVRQSLNTA